MESRFRLVCAAIAALCVGMPGGAWPEAPHAVPSAARTPSVTFSPDTFKLPAAPGVAAGGFSTSTTEPDKGVALPDRVDLGGSVLRFDTNRNVLTSAPKTGIEDADQSVLNPGIRARKDSPLQPNYFGLTLTTPTH